MKYILFNFLLYGFLGYLFEITARFIQGFELRAGILFYGPFILIYGLSIAVIYFLSEKLDNKLNIKKIYKFIFILLISVILVSVFEFIGGNIIEMAYDDIFWDYTRFGFNIGIYVSLIVSLFWGMLISVCYFFLKPLTDKIFPKIPEKLIIISIILLAINMITKVIVDFII